MMVKKLFSFTWSSRVAIGILFFVVLAGALVPRQTLALTEATITMGPDGVETIGPATEVGSGSSSGSSAGAAGGGVPVKDIGVAIELMISNIQRALEAAKEIAILGQIIELIQFINGLLDKLLNAIVEAINNIGTLFVEATRAETKAIAEASNGVRDAVWSTGQISGNASYARDKALPPAAVGYICRKTLISQMPRDLDAFREQGAAALLRGFMMEDRQGDPDGPDKTSKIIANRCGAGTNGAGGFMSPLESSSCAPKDTSSYPDMVDADIRMPMLAINEMPLEEPKMIDVPVMKDGKAVTDSSGKALRVQQFQVDKSKPQQIKFIAARDYCYNVGGVSPRPPSEEERKADGGKTREANWANCKALQGSFISACFERVYYLTRPNCSTDKGKAVCAEQQKKCANIKTSMPDVFEIKDGKCPKGLSSLQVDYISHTQCLTKEHVVSTSGAGAKASKMIGDSDVCMITTDMWKNVLAGYELEMTQSLQGMLALKGCWASTRR